MATLQDLLNSRMSREEINALLSQGNVTTQGFDQPQPMPQMQDDRPRLNSLMNLSTGRDVPITDIYGQPSQSQPMPATSMSSVPIETPWGKGRYLVGDGTRAVLNDGRIVDLGRDTARERAVEKENLALQKQRTEIAQLQAKPQSAFEAARAKVLADIEGEKIKSQMPGTAEYERVQKRDAGQKKEQSAWQGSIEQSEKIDDYINRIIGEGQYKDQGSKLGYFATGLPGQFLQNVGGTNARNLRGDLDRIKAIIGFEELNKMRRESPTGGALGQVTEQELKFLQSVEGALDQAQTPEQLEKMLWDVKMSTQRLKQDLKANPPKGFSGGATAQKSGAEQQADIIKEAQDAIARGAPRDAVMERLQAKLRGQ